MAEDVKALKAKVRKLEDELHSVQAEKDKALTASQKKMVPIRKQLDQANAELLAAELSGAQDG